MKMSAAAGGEIKDESEEKVVVMSSWVSVLSNK